MLPRVATSPDGERHDGEHPQHDAAQQQPRCAALEPAGQVAEEGVAHLESFEPRLRGREREAERQNRQRPPEQRADRIAPGRAGLVKADAAQDRAGQAVAARAVDRVVAEQCQQHEAQNAGRFADHAAAERDDEEHRIERHQDGERHQEAEQQFAGGAGVFEAVARQFGFRPQEAADVGGEPEPVDAEREHQQHGAANQQPPVAAAVAEKANGSARGRGDRCWRRRNGRFERGHGWPSGNRAGGTIPHRQMWMRG